MWGNMYYCVIAALLVVTAWTAPTMATTATNMATIQPTTIIISTMEKTNPTPNTRGMMHATCSLHTMPTLPSLSTRNFALNPDAQGKNIFFSPVGIAMALSMLAVGAKGNTHSQIYSMLGYSGLQEQQVNEGYEHLIHMLGHSQDHMQLEAGAGVAVREGFKVVDKFLKDVHHFYNSEAFSVDFSKPEIAAQEINKFIAKKTHDKITNMVKDLNPDTVMMLINYMFFRGKWDKPFDVALTHKADFNVDKDTKVQVDMMKRTGRYDIYQDHDNHTTVMMIPYKGNTSMMIILPDEGKMKEVEDFICRHHIKKWHDKLFRSSVDLFMPKFSISATSKLKTTLQDMGMVDVFGDNADLSGITDVKVKVSQVVHKAVLSVDEKGTEAAATTTIEIMPMSLPDSVNLNRPFMLLIVDDNTKSILFMGKIANPTN